MGLDAPAVAGSCFQHPEAKALAVCRRCGSFLCRVCYFDVILIHCEACAELILAEVDLPPRPLTRRAVIITTALATLSFFGLFFGLWLQGFTLLRSTLTAGLKALGVGVLSLQWAGSYSTGRLNNKGRDLFIADYLALLARTKAHLNGEDEVFLNLDILFDMDFESLELSDKLNIVRGFCDSMDRERGAVATSATLSKNPSS